MKTLKEIFYSGGFELFPTDKETVHSYLDKYEQLFSKFKNEKINIFELGVQYGGSLKLWSNYFNNAKIIGYDINLTLKPFMINNRCEYKLRNLYDIKPDEFKNNPLTIAIDDGSHILKDQIHFIKIIYPQIVDGGLLIVEDIQDIDNQMNEFVKLKIPFIVIDLRHIKNRYDDVLLIFRK